MYVYELAHAVLGWGLASPKPMGQPCSLEMWAGVGALISKQNLFSRKCWFLLSAFNSLAETHPHQEGELLSLKPTNHRC